MSPILGFRFVGFAIDKVSLASILSVVVTSWGVCFSSQALIARTKRNNNTTSAYSGVAWNSGDIIGIAVDLDNNYIYFSRNGSWINSGDPTSGSSGTNSAFSLGTPSTGFYYFGVNDADNAGSSANTYQANFGNGHFGTTAVSSAGTNASGNGIFEYDTPTGYTALSTKGLNL